MQTNFRSERLRLADGLKVSFPWFSREGSRFGSSLIGAQSTKPDRPASAVTKPADLDACSFLPFTSSRRGYSLALRAGARAVRLFHWRVTCAQILPRFSHSSLS
jgi:hypothetical protein